MRLVGCVRVSRVGGREGASFISPDVQRDQIAVYARAHGHEIVSWQEDLDQPGSTLNRPGLQAALAKVDAGEADGIIAAKLDRITRSIADLGKLLNRAAAGGWNLVAVDVGLDLGTPNGKLVAHVLGAIAEWELDRRRGDWQVARSRAVARGVHVASRTPTGYLKAADKRLIIDPDTAPAIREAFIRRAQGDGWKTLAIYLTEQGVVTPYGNETWTAAATNKMIRNRVYLGEARSGAYSLAGAHQAIVSDQEWQAAQVAGILPISRGDDPLWLTGLVRCGSCRYTAKPHYMTDRHGERLPSYRCRGRYASGMCPKPMFILARVLHKVVEEQLLGWVAINEPTARAAQTTLELDQALAAQQTAEADLLAYVSSDALAIAGQAAFEHGLTVRRQVLDDTHHQVGVLHSRVVTIGTLTATQLLDAWPSLDVHERREITGAALDAVVVWPHHSGSLPSDRVLLVPVGEAPDNMPQRGRRVPMQPWPGRPRDLRMPPPKNPEERILN